MDDLIIIGAGPYGLSAAAHLRTVRGLRFRVFGEPMSFWQRHMPAGMLLRSPWEATHIADPEGNLSLDAYTAARGNHVPAPIPLSRFVDYGRWFQQQVVPEVDTRRIGHVEPAKEGFEVTTRDGESFKTRRVIVATGILRFAWRPPEFDGLPASVASHACDHSESARFAGKRVAVLGGGQSALESAALLQEAGANVEVIVRSPRVRWLRWRKALLRWGPIGRLLYSPRDVGPAGISQLVARPNLLRLLPRRLQDKIGRRAIRPAGAVWLKDRLNGVAIRTGRVIQSAMPAAGQLRLRLDDGVELKVEHLLFATGYRVDIAKYEFLGEKLLAKIERTNGYPKLRPGLESSVPGLHFLGAPAAWSFGPVARFVSGTYYCVGALTRKIARA